MGNSGASKYEAPPAEPMPIEDSVGARHEAAALLSKRMTNASRNANDLNGTSADDEPAITRQQIAKTETFAAQPPVHGPAKRRSAASAMTRSAVLTG